MADSGGSWTFSFLASFCGAQAGLCLAWSETPKDMFCRVVAHFHNPSLEGAFVIQSNWYGIMLAVCIIIYPRMQ